MKNSLKITIAVAVVLLVIIIIYLLPKGNQGNQQNGDNSAAVSTDVPAKMLETQTPEAAKATQGLIDEVAGTGAQNVETINVTPVAGKDGVVATSTVPMKVVTVNSGTSPIDINSGKVVTKAGAAVINNSIPGMQSAPQESFPIDTKTVAIPKSSIKLDVTSSSFTPATFTVGRGQAVSLVVSNVNESTLSEVFRFDDPSLSSVAVGLAKGETKSISFNAPDKAGEYTFYSSMFNHRELGAVGKMIVK